MTKYLWLITLGQTTEQTAPWDTYRSAVVVAETPTEAKCMLPTGRAIGSQVTWCTPEFVQVKYLGIAEPDLEGTILIQEVIMSKQESFRTETQAKCLDTSLEAGVLLQNFKENLRRVQEGITDLDGASFACFPFQFSQGNMTCRGEGTNPSSPVCVLCRKLHGYEWVYTKESEQ